MDVEEDGEGRSQKRRRMDALIEKSMGFARLHDAPMNNGTAEVPSRKGTSGEGLASSPRQSTRTRKGTWTPAEDAKLRDLVQIHGRDWATIASALPHRDRKRCRERYVNHVDPTLDNRVWTAEDDERIRRLHAQFGSRWARIAQAMGCRSPDDVKNRWMTLETAPDAARNASREQRWTTAEVEALRRLVNTHGPSDWFFIASQLPGRTDLQCRQQWYHVLAPTIKKGRGTWTAEEDAILSDKVRELGPKWTEIAHSLPGRLGKQCRERYLNHLDPTLNKNPWTLFERNELARQYALHPNQWAVIAQHLPGRSENAIKNQWNTGRRKVESPGVFVSRVNRHSG